MESITTILTTVVLPFLFRAAVAVAVVLIGRWLARFGAQRLDLALRKTTLTDSLITLVVVLTHYGILIAGALIALTILGVPVNVVVGIGAVALVILGIALQQSLSNFAATVIFLLFKPFLVGDIIESNAVTGTVIEIQLFQTVILQADRKMVILPNSLIQNHGLINYSKQGILRADMIFAIGYDDDLSKAKTILQEMLAADARVLATPAPQVVVAELGSNSVNIAVRPFVNTADYWNIQNDLREQVKLRFDVEGITIPFPQQDVHLTYPAPTRSNGQASSLPE